MDVCTYVCMLICVYVRVKKFNMLVGAYIFMCIDILLDATECFGAALYCTLHKIVIKFILKIVMIMVKSTLKC